MIEYIQIIGAIILGFVVASIIVSGLALILITRVWFWVAVIAITLITQTT